MSSCYGPVVHLRLLSTPRFRECGYLRFQTGERPPGRDLHPAVCTPSQAHEFRIYAVPTQRQSIPTQQRFATYSDRLKAELQTAELQTAELQAGRRSQGQTETERAANTRLTFDPDPTAHQLDKTFGRR